MLTGRVPFSHKNHQILYWSIVNKPLELPKQWNLSKDSCSVLQGLLAKDPDKRLGVFKVEKLKEHEFFRKHK